LCAPSLLPLRWTFLDLLYGGGLWVEGRWPGAADDSWEWKLGPSAEDSTCTCSRIHATLAPFMLPYDS
ncbi:hypothetical protein BaRGS_00030172, partial [Batillaria attramentaria]